MVNSDITIKLDEDALKEQVRSATREALKEFAARLRYAAHQLDPEWAKHDEEFWEGRVNAARAEGFEKGKEAR
jgi:hypothetical protein